MFGKIFKYLFYTYVKKYKLTARQIVFGEKQLDEDFYDKIRILLEKREEEWEELDRSTGYIRASLREPNLEELKKIMEQAKIERVAFNEKLLLYIKIKGLSNSEVYKKAGIDRRHFSKIINKAEYSPKKHAVIALCFALELNKEEMIEMLSLGGYGFFEYDKTDIIIEFFIEHECFDLFSLNEALVHFGEKPIGVLE